MYLLELWFWAMCRGTTFFPCMLHATGGMAMMAGIFVLMHWRLGGQFDSADSSITLTMNILNNGHISAIANLAFSGQVFVMVQPASVCLSAVEWCFWCCRRLLLCSSCSSSPGVWSSESILRTCGSSGPGTECCCLYVAGRCHGGVPSCKVPADLRHNAEELLPYGSGSGTISCPNYDVHSSASRSSLSNTYAV